MANSATPKLKAFARQILACEAALGTPAGAKESGAFLACEKLRGPLGKLIGIGGFRSLLSRALALAGEDAPLLRALHIRADGSLEGLEAEGERDPRDPREAAAAEVELMAQIAGLLVTFIGPALTLQLLCEIWPEIDDPNFGTGETP